MRALASRSRVILLFVAPLPEMVLALGFFAISMILADYYGLQFVFPSSNALQFTGMSYIVPLSIIFALGLFMILTKRKMQLAYYLSAAFAYGTILVTHFNVKLWMSIINPRLWDGFYWETDQMARPIIEASFEVHKMVGMVLPAENHLYLFAFLAMFGSSIITHSLKCFMVFRKVIFTAMLVHTLGALSYLIAPAVGPYIFEAGVNALETARQEHMYQSYQALMIGGKPWIASQGSHYLFAAIAAMPSLHVASSAVFVYYAWKHERWLGWIYLPLFVFIIFEAMATRWHYLIDVMAGLTLTGLAITITSALFRPIAAHHATRP
ncbi:MAG: phosphatase PAP2 family protein [Parasphingorhabdus sp.]|uniref:phosphatase PAP2 family protein n=1 Tax=Parasphingorhabdus sp. TaxID=2709688 RepID=UPI003002832E